MYGHPRKSDPYAERQPIPPYVEPGEASGALIAALAVGLLIGVGSFALGYLSGVWGWFQ